MYPFQTDSIGTLSPDWLPFNNISGNSAIHIFRLSVNSHLEKLPLYQSLLNGKELLRASRFFKHEDRERFIICRGALKQLLGLYLKLAPESIVIISGKNRKPILKDHSHLHFNVSHSKNCIAIAISDINIGIDVEYINKGFNYHSVAEICFTVPEIKFMQESLAPVKEFFKLWTRKEALLKAHGRGLNDEMNKLNCLNDFYESSVYNSYTINSIEIEENYIAGIAYNCVGKKILFYEI